MKRHSFFNFIFYRYYRLAINMKLREPLYFTAAIISSYIMVIGFITKHILYDPKSLESQIFFYMIIVIGVIINFILIHHFKKKNNLDNIKKLYDEQISSKINLISDFVAIITIVGLFISCFILASP